MEHYVQDSRVAALKAALLRQNELGHFDMSFWNEPQRHGCGSVCCIGGTIEVMNQGERQGAWKAKEAGEWLGLDRDTAHALFYPPDHMNWASISVQLALDAIDVAVAVSRCDGPDYYRLVDDFWQDNLVANGGEEADLFDSGDSWEDD